MGLLKNIFISSVKNRALIFSLLKTGNMSEHLRTVDLPFEEKPLYVPSLQEIKDAISEPLAKNFTSSTVEIVDCPDLTDKKFGLVDKGLGGSPTLLEIGGPPYLLPLVQRHKLYNVKEILQRSMGNCDDIFALGAGAGPYPIRSTNCEGMFNLSVKKDGTFKNGSFTSKVSGPNEECVLERIPDNEPRCALLLNLFISNGNCEPVLKIHCKQRKGELNFIETIRKALEAKFEDKCVGMGGVFLINEGCVHQHVMRDFSKTPINTDEEVNQWLKFYDMPAKLHAMGTLVTNEHGLDLRLSHFHSFSSSNWGGHYHYDTTPDIVEYEAYLNVAERIVRVDRPIVTHKVGRD